MIVRTRPDFHHDQCDSDAGCHAECIFDDPRANDDSGIVLYTQDVDAVPDHKHDFEFDDVSPTHVIEACSSCSAVRLKVRPWNICVDCGTVFDKLYLDHDEYDEEPEQTEVECGCGRRYEVEKYEGGKTLVRVMTVEERNEQIYDNLRAALEDVTPTSDPVIMVNSLNVNGLSLCCVTIRLRNLSNLAQSEIEVANVHLRAATVLAVQEIFDEWSLVIR